MFTPIVEKGINNYLKINVKIVLVVMVTAKDLGKQRTLSFHIKVITKMMMLFY